MKPKNLKLESTFFTSLKNKYISKMFPAGESEMLSASQLLVEGNIE